MSTLYLLNYNNYYNRIVKSTTLANYKSQALYTLQDVSFKLMDSCYTEQIVNISASVNPDYVVITETANNVESISSRWFIMESKRTRAGQYKLQLRRDVFVDYNTIIGNATLFCEKGFVVDSDPLIYNSEGNQYNQIKVTEKLLKDATGSAWLVGYCDRNLMQEAIGNEIEVDMYSGGVPAYTKKYANEAAMITDFPTSSYTGLMTPYIAEVHDIGFYFGMGQGDPAKWYNVLISNSVTNATERAGSANNKVKSVSALLTYLSMIIPSEEDLASDLLLDKSASTYYDLIHQNNGTIARVGTGGTYKYYQLKVMETTTTALDSLASLTRTKATLDDMLEEAADRNLWDGSYTFPNDASVAYTRTTYIARWMEITPDVKAEIADTVPMCNTAPYYMFVIPYHAVDYEWPSGSDDSPTINSATSDPVFSMQFVQQFIKQVGTHVLDVQLLPYFPEPYLIHNGAITLQDVDKLSVTYFEDTNQVKYGFIYWGAPQTFSAIINETVDMLPSKKIDNETRFLRLNAPNYSASFDMSIAKNDGISAFHVTGTYRPYQPHIQIIPEWGGIYGQYFADGRGLICGGDYSIDIVNDQWTEYQITNKNYQLMFDRQIQTMDLRHEYQTLQQGIGMITGAFGGAGSGALSLGGLGKGGAIAGGVIGGLASLGGGIADFVYGQKLRADERGAAFDQFGYQLGNIQARPTTLTKMSALVGNNKIWPFYEIYSATSRETTLLQQQLIYGGMTVQAVGTVYEFTVNGGGPTYIRGKLIRVTGLEHDAQMSQLVADELARGIYMDVQLT